jgi:hypothetical protein
MQVARFEQGPGPESEDLLRKGETGIIRLTVADGWEVYAMKDRKLLMIPGPIEFTPAVMRAMGMPTASHVAPNFIEVFGQALERLRQVFLCPAGQPFVVAGSGTLAMEMAAANLIEPGDRALVVNTGVFGDRFAAILERFGATVTQVCAPAIGDAPAVEEVEAALQDGDFKLMTITHVDTSTAVAADVKSLAALGRQHGVLVGLAKGDRRAARTGPDSGGPTGDGDVSPARAAGRQLLCGLATVAAHHGSLRGAAAELFRHAAGQPGLGAQRQPRTDTR